MVSRRKRSARTTNVRFGKKQPMVAPHWQWIISQKNLKLSVLDAIGIAERQFGKGDLHSALLAAAEQSLGSAPISPQPTSRVTVRKAPQRKPRTSFRRTLTRPQSGSTRTSQDTNGQTDAASAIFHNLHAHRK